VPATVYLVGAGPGAPDLITLRGVRALEQAGVVLYDRLTHPALLDHAPANALRLYAGRAPGAPGDDRQETIHAQLVAHARAGRTVVRLKGGDPFVFGRGGEEMLALAEAGVPFEVVPGVTSSIGVPGVAGIPVTHRGASTAFAVFTAHEAEDATEGPVDWVVAARVPTAVFLMGVERLPVIVSKLIAHGRRVDTPIAIVEQGTCDAERVTTGTLGTILARQGRASAGDDRGGRGGGGAGSGAGPAGGSAGVACAGRAVAASAPRRGGGDGGRRPPARLRRYFFGFGSLRVIVVRRVGSWP
jgi:uroporphyrin-III C-methyltransferase